MKKALSEAIEVEKGKIPMVEVENMPAKIYKPKENIIRHSEDKKHISQNKLLESLYIVSSVLHKFYESQPPFGGCLFYKYHISLF